MGDDIQKRETCTLASDELASLAQSRRKTRHGNSRACSRSNARFWRFAPATRLCTSFAHRVTVGSSKNRPPTPLLLSISSVSLLQRAMATTQPAHEIIIVPAVGEPGRDELRQQCYDVRIDVFHREQGFPLDTEIDESVARPLPPSIRLSVADVAVFPFGFCSRALYR